MPDASLIGWLDSHSSAVTALATLMLVVITAAYVVVTYWLVREQRLQGQSPDLAQSWANARGIDDADLRLHNVGTGTAVEVMVVRGPRSCVEADMPDLGEQRTLRPGEELIWRIRPPAEAPCFQAGGLSLTVHWLDSNRSKAFFNACLIRIEDDGDAISVHDMGSASQSWNRRKLRQLGRKELSWMGRLKFQHRTRRLDVTELLVDPEVRKGVRVSLGQECDELEAWSAREEVLRNDL